MEAGDVVRTALPQADMARKPRPAILIKSCPPFNDWLVIGISSHVELAVAGLDVILGPEHPSFQRTGLSYAGVARLSFAHIIPRKHIEGVIGKVDQGTLDLIKQRFTEHIMHP
ncbi:MAG: type II toxin-antitoxin system PemK/MazF family toxin [Flavobacteriales bacterium]|nr:type II toxin-antitoxin system PemK/MazF family toxin [Flavobacteriales bacterium]MEB2342305.1 type II toxin-antitoxin system PemK/MazF family toxin [Flavobacteriia bacterium]